MKLEHIKSYKKLLDKIRSNTYNIKKEDYQHFQELTKSNTVYSFFHFSNFLFQDKEEVGIVKELWETNKISYKKFKQLRLANFYRDLYFSLTPFFSTLMIWRVEEALQIAYHTKGSYEEKALAAFNYLDN